MQQAAAVQSLQHVTAAMALADCPFWKEMAPSASGQRGSVILHFDAKTEQPSLTC